MPNGGNVMPDTMFIYALRDKDTGEIGYVGGSKDPRKRYGQHLSKNENGNKQKWLTSLKDLPELVILEEVPYNPDVWWTEREQYWIQRLHKEGHPLTNAWVDTPKPYRFQCEECGSTETPHQGGGLCQNCYMRQYRKKHSIESPPEEQLRDETRLAVANAIDRKLQSFPDSDCYIRKHTLYLRISGQTIEIPLKH